MKSCEIIIAGFGGQGILFMGQMLSYAANDLGLNVCWLPSYGPEMRGGTANCMVTYSDTEIYSPMVLKADVVVAMNKPSMVRFEKLLKPGGLLLLNTDMIDIEPTRTDVRIVRVAADSIAERAGNAKASNMVALGAFIRATGDITLEQVESTIHKKTPANRLSSIPVNIEALRQGYAAVAV